MVLLLLTKQTQPPSLALWLWGPSPNLLAAPGNDGSGMPTAIPAVVSSPLMSLGTPPLCTALGRCWFIFSSHPTPNPNPPPLSHCPS